IIIDKNMNIIGESQSGTIINGQQTGNSIFTIASGVTVTITNLTLTNATTIDGGAINNDHGTLTVRNITFTNNTANEYGGAIFNNVGNLTVENSTFTGNTALNGGAIYNEGILDIDSSNFSGNTATASGTGTGGGAIYNDGAILNINKSEFTGNAATGNAGGAIYSYSGTTITVSNSKFTENTSKAGGGAIRNNGSGTTLTVSNSKFTRNHAEYGGAICNSGIANITNSNFTDNNVTNAGGAICNDQGTLNVNNSTFTNNKAQEKGGVLYNYLTGNSNNTIRNSTFTGNTATNYGGVIYNIDSSLIVNNSTFTDNNADDEGGVIYDLSGGSLTVENSTFIGNTANYGGAISAGGGLTVENSTFTNNTANGYGGAISAGGSSTVENSTFTNNTANGYGGAIFNAGSLTVENCTFIGNIAYEGGAISNWNRLMVGNSTFTGNIATDGFGGAINNWAMTSVSFCRIVNNGSFDMLNNNGILDARYNWWGSNDNPSKHVSSGVDVSPWLILTVTVDNSPILVGGKSTVTADLQHDSDGTYHNPANEGHVPDGTPITFNLPNTSLGSLNTISTTLTNGTATTKFTAANSGNENVTATIDNQLESTLIIINKLNTTITVGNITIQDGQRTNINATLKDEKGNPLKGQDVTFIVNGTTQKETTNSAGIATFKYTPSSAGNYTVTANYNGSVNYLDCVGNGLLVVDPACYLYVNVTMSSGNLYFGDEFVVKYKLSNIGPNSASNVKLRFKIPEGLEFIKASADTGKCTYDLTTRTITWILDTVPVGDPYLNITLKALSTGDYTITPTINTRTYNKNTNTLTALKLNIQTPNNNNSNGKNTTNTVNAATQTINMQHTGAPLAGLVLAILAIFSGMLPRRKQ
ncbi:MAG: right-handed parallel beta-helix repeat-containing protein, partial [Methanobacterium paludis]|nr:right-handed parallel beta-helix repeat-containing protein [Methanobacterium paludis]